MFNIKYFAANFLSICQFIWGEDNLFSICEEEGVGGGVIYERDARMD